MKNKSNWGLDDIQENEETAVTVHKQSRLDISKAGNQFFFDKISLISAHLLP